MIEVPLENITVLYGIEMFKGSPRSGPPIMPSGGQVFFWCSGEVKPLKINRLYLHD